MTKEKRDWLKRVQATRFQRPMNYYVPVCTEHDNDHYLLSDYYIENHTIDELEAMHKDMEIMVEGRQKRFTELMNQFE
jgi:hypothetical protein